MIILGLLLISIAAIVFTTVYLKLHPFLALFLTAIGYGYFQESRPRTSLRM